MIQYRNYDLRTYIITATASHLPTIVHIIQQGGICELLDNIIKLIIIV